MGFENFRVELCGGSASSARAEDAVRRLPYARPDPDSMALPGSAYFAIDDGTHVIEVEVSDAPVQVSCRFTLCHPDSIDAAFLGLVRELQGRLGMDVHVCDDVRSEESRCFPSARFSEFAAVARDTIARRRAEWVANFGTAQLAGKTSEVYEKIILPKCLPVGG